MYVYTILGGKTSKPMQQLWDNVDKELIKLRFHISKVDNAMAFSFVEVGGIQIYISIYICVKLHIYIYKYMNDK